MVRELKKVIPGCKTLGSFNVTIMGSDIEGVEDNAMDFSGHRHADMAIPSIMQP